MDTAINDAGTQRGGMSTLGQLASHGGVAWQGTASAAVGRVLRAMQRHTRCAETQAVGLWALGRLAERVEAPAAGMHDAAERARRHHPHSALVHRQADQLTAFLTRP